MRLENLKIFTMGGDREVIENGWIEFDGGKITAVGECADGECKGWLFPGFIDGHTHIGIIGDSLGFESDDVNETGDPITPNLRSLDAINPFDRCFSEARAAGVTTVAVAPGSANPIGGQICVIKTAGHRVDDMVIMQPAAMKFALGENPKGVYHGKNQLPETRMATAALIRENLIKAKKYADDMDKAHTPPENPEDDAPDEPDFDMKLDALVPVVRGKIPAHFHAHRADDIFTAIRIANEFNLKYALVHCTEGRLITSDLAAEGACAFVGPNLTDRSKPELSNQSYENPAALSKAGVHFGITTDHPVIPLQYLPLCASLAVKNGMDELEAIRAITINPAKILNVDARVGSLEAGKDADMVLFTGNPFDMRSRVSGVWIDGNVVS